MRWEGRDNGRGSEHDLAQHVPLLLGGGSGETSSDERQLFVQAVVVRLAHLCIRGQQGDVRVGTRAANAVQAELNGDDDGVMVIGEVGVDTSEHPDVAHAAQEPAPDDHNIDGVAIPLDWLARELVSRGGAAGELVDVAVLEEAVGHGEALGGAIVQKSRAGLVASASPVGPQGAPKRLAVLRGADLGVGVRQLQV